MKRRNLLAVLFVAVVFVCGALVASNMGFQLNYQMFGPGPMSASGINEFAPPFLPQEGMNNTEDLLLDLAAAGTNPVNVQRFGRPSDEWFTYNGQSGTPDPLIPGVGWRVQLASDANYLIVGSHDPGAVVIFVEPGGPFPGSLSGINQYAVPYHATAADAKDLLDEFRTAAGSVAAVTNVQKFQPQFDQWFIYNGTSGTAFTWVPGQAIRVQVTEQVAFVPSHY